MGEWWHASGAQRSGPVDEETIARLLQEDRISSTTLVWRVGLDEWIPIGAVDELSHLLKTVPPPLPSERPLAAKLQRQEDTPRPDATAPVSLTAPSALPLGTATDPDVGLIAATPWRRWLARLFDLWIEVIIVLVLLLLVSMVRPTVASEWMRTPSAALFLTLGLVPAALVLDACIYALFGTTAGKAILRVRIVAEADTQPSGWQYLTRNLSMWGSGLAFGLPLFSLISMAYQARRLRQGRSATYDTAAFQAVQQRIGLARRLVFAAAFVALLFANLVFTIVADKIAQIERTEALTPTPSATQAREAAAQMPQVPPAAAPRSAAESAAELADSPCAEHFYGGVGPIIANRKLEVRTSSLCYQGAGVAYSAITYTPLWSAEHLTADKLEKADVLNFIPHTREELGIPESDRASAADFEFDRYSVVPLTPPGRLATALARIESSSFASVVPMRHGSLAIAWAELGESIALHARRGGDVFIVSGTLFEGDMLTKLNDRLLVPTGLYIAFVDVRTKAVGAYVLENREGAKVRKIELPDLERRAGVLLFPALGPDMYPAPERKAVKPAIKEAAADFSTCAMPERSLASIRNAEEGTSTVAFLVDSNGAVLDSNVERSSGYPHLDTAARDAIRLCKFTPAKRDGAPYKSWTSVAYVWS